MRKIHKNIPIFIPHMGCPNMCVFCNQRTITGVSEQCDSNVKAIIDRALSTIEEDADTEIAFFGGSFTGIDRALMIELLEIGQKYIDSGKVKGMRLSTRPDYISEDALPAMSVQVQMYFLRFPCTQE
jgi:histone acetyltransferase (RNA polymerase elongator complex component)